MNEHHFKTISLSPEDLATKANASQTHVMNEIQRILGTDYTLLESIGKGGMGVVFKAVDNTLHREVAIKILQTSHDPIHIKRFFYEAHLASQLNHPFIVHIHTVIDDPHIPMIIMEYVKGETLSQFVLSNPYISHKPLVTLFIKIISALSFAHQNGIIHRDIKPGNILILPDLTPKILDFGLAKRLTPSDRHMEHTHTTLDGSILGSPAFMSPEQAHGQLSLISSASDQYSCCASLYYCLTKKLPFEGDSVFEIIEKVKLKEAILPSYYDPSLPKDLEAIVLKGMEKRMENRYDSMISLKNDLTAFVENKPVQAKIYTHSEIIKRAIVKKKKFIGVCALTLMVIYISGLSIAISQYRASTSSLEKGLKDKVKTIATLASFQIDGDSVKALQTKEDKHSQQAKELALKLNKIKLSNPMIQYVYIVRPSRSTRKIMEFVLEHDSLYDDKTLDVNHNGIVDPLETPPEIGELYADSVLYPGMFEGLLIPSADDTIYDSDQWGISLSGYAPISDQNNTIQGVLCVDFGSSDVHRVFQNIKSNVRVIIILNTLFCLTFMLLVLLHAVYTWKRQA